MLPIDQTRKNVDALTLLMKAEFPEKKHKDCLRVSKKLFGGLLVYVKDAYKRKHSAEVCNISPL